MTAGGKTGTGYNKENGNSKLTSDVQFNLHRNRFGCIWFMDCHTFYHLAVAFTRCGYLHDRCGRPRAIIATLAFIRLWMQRWQFLIACEDGFIVIIVDVVVVVIIIEEAAAAAHIHTRFNEVWYGNSDDDEGDGGVQQQTAANGINNTTNMLLLIYMQIGWRKIEKKRCEGEGQGCLGVERRARARHEIPPPDGKWKINFEHNNELNIGRTNCVCMCLCIRPKACCCIGSGSRQQPADTSSLLVCLCAFSVFFSFLFCPFSLPLRRLFPRRARMTRDGEWHKIHNNSLFGKFNCASYCTDSDAANKDGGRRRWWRRRVGGANNGSRFDGTLAYG